MTMTGETETGPDAATAVDGPEPTEEYAVTVARSWLGAHRPAATEAPAEIPAARNAASYDDPLEVARRSLGLDAASGDLPRHQVEPAPTAQPHLPAGWAERRDRALEEARRALEETAAQLAAEEAAERMAAEAEEQRRAAVEAERAARAEAAELERRLRDEEASRRERDAAVIGFAASGPSVVLDREALEVIKRREIERDPGRHLPWNAALVVLIAVALLLGYRALTDDLSPTDAFCAAAPRLNITSTEETLAKLAAGAAPGNAFATFRDGQFAYRTDNRIADPVRAAADRLEQAHAALAEREGRRTSSAAYERLGSELFQADTDLRTTCAELSG